MQDSEIAQPSFPPLLRGEAADDPFARAIARAKGGADPGLVTHRVRPDRLTAALLLAPECDVADAMAMVLAVANGFADGFGALAPSEVACEFRWPDILLVNGAACGSIRAAASTQDAEAEPDWLVIGFDVRFFAASDTEPGATPEHTTLWEEGCGDIPPQALLESWSRHTLTWIHEWLDSGMPRLARDFTGRMAGLGKAVALDLPGGAYAGSVLGLDERGGLLLKDGERTVLVPLTALLEPA